MDKHELEGIVSRLRARQNEDGRVEVKSCQFKLSQDVWETISAFANTKGGLLILGVDQSDNFKPVPNFSIDKVSAQFVNGAGGGGNVNALIGNPPFYEMDRQDLEGHQVLVVEIEELPIQRKPCYVTKRGINGGSYKRIDDKDVRLSPTEVYELINAETPSSADREVVEDSQLGDLDDKMLDSLIQQEAERGSRALKGLSDRNTQLARLNITDAKGKPRLAGMLVFGCYPQQYFPKLVIDVAAYPTNVRGNPQHERFLDRMVCEGGLLDATSQALAFIAKNLRTYSVVSGKGRTDKLEIPEEAIREALVNAVVHREYSRDFIGQSVSVDIFPDRIDIKSPGGLWGGKTLDNIANGESRCRNAALMKLLSIVPFRNTDQKPAEGHGDGIPFMIQVMKEHAQAEPEFDAGFDFFKVTLYRGGAEMTANRAWLEGIAAARLPVHEQTILLEARRAEAVGVDDIRRLIQIDSDEIRTLLSDLVHKGMLVKDVQEKYRLSGTVNINMASLNVEERILGSLEAGPLTIRQLAEATDKKVTTLRPYVKKLVSRGLVNAIGAQSSRNRYYEINKGAD